MGADIFFQILLPSQPEVELQSNNLVNTKLGYIIGGTILQQKAPDNKVTLFCSTCNNNINDEIKNFFEVEKVPQAYCEKLSEHDLAEDIFQKSVKLNNNKFQVDIPLKVPISEVNSHLGNSFDLTLHRFLSLEKRLHKNPLLLTEYEKFIQEYVELGHGQYIDFQTYDLEQDPVYFLPHHAVVNEFSKTTRTRVVFDASMKTNLKVSLNDLMLNGSLPQKELFDIILLYRIGDFTFSTDIQKMFRNVLVNPEHASLQNILWRSHPSDTIQCIRLNTVTYGMKSSSFLATRCLLELTDRYGTDYPLASFILNNCTYIDDILYSTSDKLELLEAKAQLEAILQKGGFRTHKWASNSPDILSDIPYSEQQFNELELQKDSCTMKALGLHVDIKNDCFTMSCPNNFDNDVVTKRSILSYIARFYDPMGFVSPIIVKAKVILQKLWLDKLDWNAVPPAAVKEEWLRFAADLFAMDPICFNRNIPVPKSAEAVQLIGFADASTSTGYGCCVYLRVVDKTGKVNIALLCSKSRINSHSKPLTIPRLELNAALLLTHLIKRTHDTLSLKLKINNVYLFTDSMIVLGWLNTEIINLQAYVANRVKIIKEVSSQYQWQYINTKENPADLISRGMDPQEIASCSLWWHGPSFLQNGKYEFSDNSQNLPTVTLPELKKVPPSGDQLVTLSTQVQNDLFEFLQKYSDIHKMTRVMAYVLRFCNNIKTKNNKTLLNYLSSEELTRALNLIIKQEQYVHFNQEIKNLKQNRDMVGPVKSLHPFLDDQGLLRVGGRLQNSQIPYEQKHQIILHKESKVTELIIRSEHQRLFHAGPKLLLSILNQKYWLINAMRQIKKITHKCLVCFRMKAESAKQLMGSLPQQRVTACKPFLKVGVDFAGPLPVKNSRIRRSVETKGYICVFVCFVTKAVHLELSSDLTTDSYLACFKRLIARRGLPSEVFADNGTNFRGAANQLADLYRLHAASEHQTRVQSFSAQQGIRFHFVPSYSPVFAGLAEAAVKSTKFHLKRILQKLVLTYEQLNTILVQIEGILNSRPLVPMSSDINDFSYLTPGHFLTGSAIMSYPEKDISDLPTNRLKFWKVCEHVKQCFWSIWHKYYLNSLQCRSKWQSSVPNVTEGMLVILREPNCPPLHWPLARVSKVFPGKDGKVRAIEVTAPNGKTYMRSLSGICVLPLDDNLT
ncbi:hypothetical protein ABMA28_016875 [Loxostege sticticalis]|uniref:Integrase catalytic domain-containing protein n=1 Tax=Loxostege sticticalis TaxID=481309 RepID=A0ABD0T669_LOXSC